MKKYFKSIIFIFLLLILSSQLVYCEELLYEESKNSTVTDGVTHDNIKRFTINGWLNINVLRIDLTNKNINVDTMFDQDGSSIRQTVLDMTNESGAIAGINGDFFAPRLNTNLAHAIGPLVQNGKLITTPVEKENTKIFSVFALTKNNTPLYSYWTKKSTLTTPNGNSMNIYDFNKFGWFEFLYMYDRNWAPKTIGKSDKFANVIDMVVINNKVSSFNKTGNPIDIPKNGYVISADTDFDAGKFLVDNFKIGDKVVVSTTTSPNWKNIKMALGGGSIIVKNGAIPTTFSHEKPAPGPQTIIGTSKDNKELLLVTVDGRQILSKGMDQTESAKLMIGLGAYNAMLVDGGGSTTLVSRDSFHKDVQIVNSYSDPNSRPVVNGVGVYSTAPKGVLKELSIDTIDKNIFINTSRDFYVLGTDTYYNPIDVSPKDVKWSFSGIEGKMIGNILYPTSKGRGKVTAEVNGIKTSIDINIIDSPVELKLNKTNFPITKTPQWIRVDGINKNGYSAFIDSNDLMFDTRDFIILTNNFLKSKNEKAGIIKVSLGNLYTYFSIGAGSSMLDSFETDRDSFWGYPSTVTGEYSVSNEIFKEGKGSGKLSFDFSKTDGTKAAYIKLGNNGIVLNKNQKINLWIYSKTAYPYAIKLEYTDSTGEVLRATFANSINWTGWKEKSITFDDKTSFPITLKKIYIVDTGNDIRSGEVYFDNLNTSNTEGSLKLPASKKIADYQNKSVSLSSSANSYNLSIFGDISTNNKILIDKVNLSSNKTAYSLYLGNIPTGLNEPTYGNKNFYVNDYKNSKIINIKAKGERNSIRICDYTQWIKLFEALKDNSKDNIFISLDCSLDSFYDQYEAKLFKETLGKYAGNKNIWILYPSDKNVSVNINGIKYIGVKKCSTRPSDKQYLSITINNKDVTYMFKRIGM